jgi:metal-dependent HD superfamily phosphatase/phosphodiesterase
MKKEDQPGLGPFIDEERIASLPVGMSHYLLERMQIEPGPVQIIPTAAPIERNGEPLGVTLADVMADPEVEALIEGARVMMEALRYTDHSKRHTCLIAERAGSILRALDYDEIIVEKAKISGYLHDIGNAIARHEHELTGARMAYNILTRLGMPFADAIDVAASIANHDEKEGQPISILAAALILADKSDVHRSRVMSRETVDRYDIHDRVNYAVTESDLSVDRSLAKIVLSLTVDTAISSVSDYFEIFLSRMVMCRHAARCLGTSFSLVINGVELM